MAMFLDESEIVKLTKRKRAKAQQRQLNAMGIQHKIRADGSLVVLSAHVEKLLGACGKQAARARAELGSAGVCLRREAHKIGDCHRAGCCITVLTITMFRQAWNRGGMGRKNSASATRCLKHTEPGRRALRISMRPRRWRSCWIDTRWKSCRPRGQSSSLTIIGTYAGCDRSLASCCLRICVHSLFTSSSTSRRRRIST